MKVPAHIQRPDYAETGQPFSEIESRQQSVGAIVPQTNIQFSIPALFAHPGNDHIEDGLTLCTGMQCL